MSEKKFPYKQSLSFLFFGMVMFGSFTALGGYITFQEGALHHWLITAFMSVLFLMFLFILISGITSSHELVLTDKNMQLTKNGVASKKRTVEFDKVIDVRFYDLRGVVFFDVIHEGGTFRVNAGMLPKAEDFEYIANYIDDKTSY